MLYKNVLVVELQNDMNYLNNNHNIKLILRELEPLIKSNMMAKNVLLMDVVLSKVSQSVLCDVKSKEFPCLKYLGNNTQI